jgi:hypothetical protein
MKNSAVSKYGFYLFQNLKLAVLFCFISVSAIFCKKSSPGDSLPPITQEGKNTFGCKINGKVWVPHWNCLYLTGGTAEMDYAIVPKTDSSLLPLVWEMHLGREADFSLFSFQQAPTLSDHLIYHPGNIFDSLRIDYIGPPVNLYNNINVFVKIVPRFFNIDKLDTLNKIVAGTFAFTLYGSDNNSNLDSVVITEGRFDLQIGVYSRCSN